MNPISPVASQVKKMEGHRAQMMAFVLAMSIFRVAHGWGVDGHYTICKIAQVKFTCNYANRLPLRFVLYGYSLVRMGFGILLWTVSVDRSGGGCSEATAAGVGRGLGERVFVGGPSEVSLSLVLCASLHRYA